MADNSKIEWCDATWNPVTGCTKVSPGCDNCYAERVTNRFKRHPFEQVRLYSNRLDQPTHWKKPRKIFVCSMGDLFHSQVPWKFIIEVFRKMESCPQHTFQVLTKRPGRMAHFANWVWPDAHDSNTPYWPNNVWAGTSVESQKYAPRLDVLARVPAKVRFVSYEPALGPVDFRPWLANGFEAAPSGSKAPQHPVNERGKVRICSHCCHKDRCDKPDHFYRPECPWCKGKGVLPPRRLDWVIAGGESGPGARPAHPDWFRDARDACQAAGVPFFFKQFGEWLPVDSDLANVPDKSRIGLFDGAGWLPGAWCDGDQNMLHVGKKAAGALLDGRAWREMPDGHR